jgi:DNA-binding NarL/FixJ family response regulator
MRVQDAAVKLVIRLTSSIIEAAAGRCATMTDHSSFQTRDLPSLRVLLADADQSVAEGMADTLSPVIGSYETANDGISVVKRVLTGAIDLVVSDITLPLLSGFQALQQLREKGSSVPFIVLSAHGDPAVTREALLSGCNGYVVKQLVSEELCRAVEAVVHGYQYLSPSALTAIMLAPPPAHRLSRRQGQIINCVADGFRTAEIATSLGISPRTVESHRQALLRLFGVHNSIALIREAEKQGLVRQGMARRMTEVSLDPALS